MGNDAFHGVLERFGDRFAPDVLAATVAHWTARAGDAQGGLPAIVGVPYGEHPRHRLDLFPVRAEKAAVVLFVHGGGFNGGDKQVAPPFYANVGRYFAAHGIFAACMNYRLAPDGGWPAAAHDVDAAAQWLLQRADLYGGNPDRLFVIGQSAGACHVATWMFHPDFERGARKQAKAAVLMSGFYRALAPLSAGQTAYFGDDPVLYEERSPITHAARAGRAGASLLLTFADHDPPELRRQTSELAQALSHAGGPAQLLELKGHNHVSPAMSLGSDDDRVGQQLRRFVSEFATSSLFPA